MSSDWVPLTHRYGITGPTELHRWVKAGGENFDAERWRGRHNQAVAVWREIPELACYVDQRLRCVCQSSPGRYRCSERASQEDRLCDMCRQHCVAVDESGHYHRLVDVYGAAQ